MESLRSNAESSIDPVRAHKHYSHTRATIACAHYPSQHPRHPLLTPPPQRAIDYARSHYAVVYLPLGTYRVTDTLLVQQAQRAMSTGYKPGGVRQCGFRMQMRELCMFVIAFQASCIDSCVCACTCVRVRVCLVCVHILCMFVCSFILCSIANHLFCVRSSTKGLHVRLPIGRRLVSLGAELHAGGRGPGQKSLHSPAP